MISTQFKGGLGNQLFQMAAAINLALQNNDTYKFNLHWWPPRGGASEKTTQIQVEHPMTYKNTVYKNIPHYDLTYEDVPLRCMQRGNHYEKIPYPEDMSMIIDGYFSSEKFFIDSEEVIRSLFYPDKDYQNIFKKKYAHIPGTKTVLHVRRGSHMEDAEHYERVSENKNYYDSAMAEFENTTFIVFSDEIEWCKENFEGENIIFSENSEVWEDFYDMVLCDHYIIANSTFSWWGAWLNNNPDKKIIYPAKWFGPAYAELDIKDMIPEGWIKL
jgi:hypothetical protein